MDPTTITLATLLDLINAFGTLGVLVMIIWWFFVGAILPRKVYERLVESIIEATVQAVLEKLGYCKK